MVNRKVQMVTWISSFPNLVAMVSGTNPEQLFAAGWSACFEGAMEKAAQRIGIKLPEDTAIDAEVDLCVDNGEFWLQARLTISLPGLDKAVAQQIVETAHTICPYSKAITGNVHVEFNHTLIDQQELTAGVKKK